MDTGTSIYSLYGGMRKKLDTCCVWIWIWGWIFSFTRNEIG